MSTKNNNNSNNSNNLSEGFQPAGAILLVDGRQSTATASTHSYASISDPDTLSVSINNAPSSSLHRRGGFGNGAASTDDEDARHEEVEEHAVVYTLLSNTARTFGNSRPLCGGRCLLASDSRYSLMVLCLILAPLSAFNFVWVSEYFSPHEGAVVRGYLCLLPLLGADVLALASLVLMFTAVLKNPGVLRRYPPDVPNAPPEGHVAFMDVNGMRVVLPYCRTCNIVRPPRASHCSVCNVCVMGFDHHCGVIGACVGRRNLRYFFGFLVVTTLLTVWSTVWSAVVLVNLSKGDINVRLVCTSVSLVCAAGFGILTGSMSFHYMRIFSSGLTQREYIKQEILYGGTKVNPFDSGCGRNCSLALNCREEDYGYEFQ